MTPKQVQELIAKAETYRDVVCADIPAHIARQNEARSTVDAHAVIGSAVYADVAAQNAGEHPAPAPLQTAPKAEGAAILKMLGGF